MTARALTEAALDGDARGLFDAVRLHTADALACLTAARRTPEGAALDALFQPYDRPGADAAILRYSEADSIHVPSCLTPAAVTVPVALACASDGPAYVRAVAAGTAIGLALANGVGGAAALGRGIWPTLLAAPAMASVTAGVAGGRPVDEIARALSLSLAGRSGRAGRPGGWPSGRWLVIGWAVLDGLRAAEAARAGAAGDTDIPGEDWLAAQAGAEMACPAALAGADPSAIARVGLKPFVTARQAATAVAAFHTLLEQGLQPHAIETAEVALPPETLPVISRPAVAGDRLSMIANLGVQFGMAAHRPEALFDIARDAAPPPAALDLAKRVRLVGDSDLSARSDETHWPARVRVTAAGRTFDHCLVRLSGDAGDPLAADVVAAKRDAWGLREKDQMIEAADADALLAAARDARQAASAEALPHSGGWSRGTASLG